MKDALTNLQILYDIAMSIGTSLDMNTMLQKCLGTYLQKLHCKGGAIVQGSREDKGGAIIFRRRLIAPSTIEDNPTIKNAMAQIPRCIPADEVENYLGKLPYVGRHDDLQAHVMELPNFGLLLLFKEGQPIVPSLIEGLAPLNTKLATACQNCLRKKRIRVIANELKR